MMKNFVVLLLIFCYSCGNKVKERANSVEINPIVINYQDGGKVNKLLALSVNKGDFDAFNELSNVLFLNDDLSTVYYYSQIMANKYNCPEAYYNLYHVLTNRVTINGITMYSEDSVTNSLAKFYILKSYELGFEPAVSDVELLFGTNSIPKSSQYVRFLK